MRTLSRASAALFVALGALSGCTSLLGDFSTGGGGPTDGGNGGDVGVGGGDAGVKHDGSAPPDGSMVAMDGGEDAPLDTGPEAPPPPPPPPPGKPGLDLTSGGNTSQSINYKVVAALGEAPGGANLVAKSANYTLRGGVIAGTQSQ